MKPNKSKQPGSGEVSSFIAFWILFLTFFGLVFGVVFVSKDYEYPFGIVTAALGVSIPAFIGCFLCGLFVQHWMYPAFLVALMISFGGFMYLINPEMHKCEDTHIMIASLSGIICSFLGAHIGSVVKKRRAQKN